MRASLLTLALAACATAPTDVARALPACLASRHDAAALAECRSREESDDGP